MQAPSETGIDVQVVRGNKSGERISGRLLAISTADLKVQLAEPIQFDEQIQIDLGDVDGIDSLPLPATAKMIQQTSEGQFQASCTLGSDVSGLLHRLAQLGVVNRRSGERMPVHRVGKARWEGNPAAFDVQIQDIHQYGCCLKLNGQIPDGERVLLQFEEDQSDEPFLITATRKWRSQTNNDVLIGCEFDSPNDLRQFGIIDEPKMIVPAIKPGLFQRLAQFVPFLGGVTQQTT